MVVSGSIDVKQNYIFYNTPLFIALQANKYVLGVNDIIVYTNALMCIQITVLEDEAEQQYSVLWFALIAVNGKCFDKLNVKLLLLKLKKNIERFYDFTGNNAMKTANENCIKNSLLATAIWLAFDWSVFSL